MWRLKYSEENVSKWQAAGEEWKLLFVFSSSIMSSNPSSSMFDKLETDERLLSEAWIKRTETVQTKSHQIISDSDPRLLLSTCPSVLERHAEPQISADGQTSSLYGRSLPSVCVWMDEWGAEGFYKCSPFTKSDPTACSC